MTAPDTEALAQQLTQIAHADYKQDDPTTGEYFYSEGKVLIDAAVELHRLQGEVERLRSHSNAHHLEAVKMIGEMGVIKEENKALRTLLKTARADAYEEVDRVEFQLGQLRHAYSHLIGGTMGSAAKLANGLISPAISCFEGVPAELRRLQGEVERLEDKAETWSSLNKVLHDENKALRAQLKTAVEALEYFASTGSCYTEFDGGKRARKALAAIRGRAKE